MAPFVMSVVMRAYASQQETKVPLKPCAYYFVFHTDDMKTEHDEFDIKLTTVRLKKTITDFHTLFEDNRIENGTAFHIEIVLMTPCSQSAVPFKFTDADKRRLDVIGTHAFDDIKINKNVRCSFGITEEMTFESHPDSREEIDKLIEYITARFTPLGFEHRSYFQAVSGLEVEYYANEVPYMPFFQDVALVDPIHGNESIPETEVQRLNRARFSQAFLLYTPFTDIPTFQPQSSSSS